MAEASKDTIYIDIDDEITSVIDKVQSSKQKIVALVLPKRASVFQSIVNMKLLKRAAAQSKKSIVLITSELAVVSLAGAVKVHVAKTLHTKPAIPAAPKTVPKEEPEAPMDQDSDEDEPDLDKTASVGELSGDEEEELLEAEKANPEETIELDNQEENQHVLDEKPDKKAAKAEKKLKVPNFNQFRKRILIGAGIFVLLIIFWVYAAFFMPKATITIKTDSVSVNTDIAFTASTSAKSFDQAKAIVPATSVETKKSSSEKTAATGKKNVGEKATGSVSLKNCTKTDGSVTLPAGTGVSTNGLNFLLASSITLPASSFTGGGSCTTAAKSVDVVAQNAGDQYNISAGRTFSVSGNSLISGVDSSAMTGGTNKEVTVVSQEDIDNKKNAITDANKAAAKTELQKQLQDKNLYALLETFNAEDTAFTSSPKVGDEASEVSITGETKLSMLGIEEDMLNTLIDASVKDKIDTSKQAISSRGLDQGVFRLSDRGNGKEQKLSLQTTVSTGVQVKQEELKKEIAGKKKGDVQQTLQALPGVKEVDVRYNVFWATKTPKNINKITLVFEQIKSDDQNQ